MTPRQRVLAAIGHEEADRTPMDFSANAETFARLMEYFHIETHRELLERLHVDIVDIRGVVDPVYHGPIPKETIRPDGVKENYLGWRTRSMHTATGVEESFCEFALASARTIQDLERHCWPDADWFDFSDFGHRLEPWEDLAIMASGASVFQHLTFLRGFDNLLTDMSSSPELYDLLADRFTDFYLGYYDRMLLAADGRIDIFRIADDLAMQDRLLMSPASFDRYIAPRLAKLIELGHRHGAKVMFHSCGAIEPLIGRLIELGVDILDPIQVRARGMDPLHLKRTYGAKLTFHGSIDTQHTLPHGTAADVAQEVRRMIGAFGPGGGFILAPSHVLQSDVPTQNIESLYDTVFA